jgi:hypothetical protein
MIVYFNFVYRAVSFGDCVEISEQIILWSVVKFCIWKIFSECHTPHLAAL